MTYLYSNVMRPLFLGIIFLFAFFTSAFAQIGAVAVPIINLAPAQFFTQEDILYIEGSSYPDAEIELELRADGRGHYMLQTRADANGSWAIAERLLLAEGDWQIRARSVVDGVPSAWSSSRVIKSITTGIQLGVFSVSYGILSILLFLILLLGGGIMIYLTRRVRFAELYLLKKEAEEAHHKTAEGFQIMRTSILEELQLIDKKSTDGMISQEDLIKRERLLRELHNLEDTIRREIEDVQKLL